MDIEDSVGEASERRGAGISCCSYFYIFVGATVNRGNQVEIEINK